MQRSVSTVHHQRLLSLRPMVQTPGRGSLEQHEEGCEGDSGPGLRRRLGFRFEEAGGWMPGQMIKICLSRYRSFCGSKPRKFTMRLKKVRNGFIKESGHISWRRYSLHRAGVRRQWQSLMRPREDIQRIGWVSACRGRSWTGALPWRALRLLGRKKKLKRCREESCIAKPQSSQGLAWNLRIVDHITR